MSPTIGHFFAMCRFRHVDLTGVEWNRGGTIELDISSTKFPFEPVRFQLRNEATGRSYTGDRQNQYWKHEKTTHEGLMPGTWVYELFGRESLVGEKLMLSKKIEVKEGETILFDGRL